MVDLSNLLAEKEVYYKLEKALKNRERDIFFDNMSLVQISFITSLLYKELDRSIVIVATNEIIGMKIANDINTVLDQNIATVFMSREIIYRNIETSSREYEHHRLKTIYKLFDFEKLGVSIKEAKIIIVPVESLYQYIMTPERYKNLVFELKVGQIIKIQDLIKKLVLLGFIKSYQVDGVGQFSVRGEIIDIFPPHLEYPVRIDFWDDEIDNIFFFDIETQRKIGNRLKNIFISPAREIIIDDMEELSKKLEKLRDRISNKEVRQNIEIDIEKIRNRVMLENIDKYLPIIYEDKASIIDYIDDPVIFFTDKEKIDGMVKSVWWHYLKDLEKLLEDNILTKDFGVHIFSKEDIESNIKRYFKIYASVFDKIDQKDDNYQFINICQKELAPWNGNMVLLESSLRDYIKNDYLIVIFAGSDWMVKSLIKELRSKSFIVSDRDDENVNILIIKGTLSSGIEYYKDRLAFITINKDMHSEKKIRKRRKSDGESIINSLEDLEIGDYVVHVNHGIGIFKGIDRLEIDGVINDYIKIQYSGTDILYLPVMQLDLVSKYIGNKEDKIIKLNKLNSVEWSKRKYVVKKAVKDIAKDLIKLQSERLKIGGYAFSEDTEWQREFEEDFEYEETDAQLRCIEEIKLDMEKPHPMDRLLCGDVGVGKTEVALRMAFKTIMDSKQVVFLTPTTILSWQHYKTIISRFNKFPIKIEILTRLRTPKQQKSIINQLKTGEVEIVVGTHRLLQKDIQFKDLGLVIIDEEQRFGVTDKEKFKKLKHNVDVLTLSATPIPRTLSMAMNGVKDISIIDEPPHDRLPVQTYVLEYDDNIIESAILKEIKRGGMVFYLHNRVETIERVVDKLSNMIPELRICIAHGKMLQSQLTQVWEKLLNHEADVLVCTTIIETGIDIPFCNTLIVENSDNMGLAQLHQLRGRIGRSDKRGYAYMTFPKGKMLSDISIKRLNAIKEYTSFGAGFKIALRDLQIRGAGNILGAQQHGHIEAVGYDMYMKLLNEAIAEEKGETKDFLVSEKCTIDIKTSAYLPEDYIVNLSNRIDIYKKIALVKTKNEYEDLMDELIDRFGEPPQEVISLLDVSLTRNIAIENNIREISQKGKDIYIYQDPLDKQWIEKLTKSYGKNVIINFNARPFLKVKLDKSDDAHDFIVNIFSNL